MEWFYLKETRWWHNHIVFLYSWFENTGDNCLSCATVVPILQHQTCSFVALKRHVQTYFHILITHFLACVKYAPTCFSNPFSWMFHFFHNKHGQSYQSSFSFLFFSLISWLIFNSFCCDGSHFGSNCLISVVFLSLILFVWPFCIFSYSCFLILFCVTFRFFLFYSFSSFCISFYPILSLGSFCVSLW